MKRFLPYFRYLKPVRLQFVLAILAGAGYGISTGFGLPVMAKTIFPILFEDEEGMEGVPQWFLDLANAFIGDFDRTGLLIVSCAAIPAVFAFRGLCQYFNTFLMNYCGLRVVADLQVDLYNKIQRMQLAFFQRYKSGDLLARISGDTEAVRTVVINGSNDLIKHPFTLVSAVAVIAYLAITEQSFLFAGIGALSVPLCVLPIRAIGKNLRKRGRQIADLQGEQRAYTIESLQSPMEIRAYNLQDAQTDAFSGRVGGIVRVMMKIVRYSTAITPAVEIVAAAGLSFALYLGVSRGMDLGTFIALAFALFMAYEPVKKLGKLFGTLRTIEGPLDRIEEILHQPVGVDDPAQPEEIRGIAGRYRFERVAFSYDGSDERALNGVDVAVEPGECVALVGPSGAGKSTFAHLLCRFYDPVEGAVSVDGRDLRALRQRDLRDHIAVVPQTPVLFSASIRDNILLGKPGASDEQVEAAARNAYAHDFIAAMPEGYDSIVAERGASLSGGQRQRIALARAFLRDAPVLVLDEATSALDSESEEAIQKAMTELVRGRTTFIIAHRFSSITFATRILLFDAGRIVSDGTHDELMAGSELYQRLAKRQML